MVVIEDLGSQGSPGHAEAVEIIHQELVSREGVMLEERRRNAGCGRGALKSAENRSKVGILGELLAELHSEFGGGRQSGDGRD
jgi:hypothetical protein